MLDGILGNKTAEQVLLSLFHYGELHASGIAEGTKGSLTPIINQLERFENAGVLISKQVGRSRVYSFNSKSPFTKPLKKILEIAYENIPLKERQKLFSKRFRPRRKGKEVIT